MLDRLRERVAACLAHAPVCLLSTQSADGVRALPVRCRSSGLDVECLVPRWADVVFDLERDPRALLIFHNTEVPDMRWLQYRGRACVLSMSANVGQWPAGIAVHNRADRFVAVQIMPSRIDLIDESRGWGILETLEF
ncbi:MAG: pyridoxamine 5'-phosphate oxidase family protein [Chloroflexi bacterium]|nr:pyridoxamine 5'-phosphate oxidase family protein [Chloroflexota bacterium]